MFLNIKLYENFNKCVTWKIDRFTEFSLIPVILTLFFRGIKIQNKIERFKFNLCEERLKGCNKFWSKHRKALRVQRFRSKRENWFKGDLTMFPFVNVLFMQLRWDNSTWKLLLEVWVNTGTRNFAIISISKSARTYSSRKRSKSL